MTDESKFPEGWHWFANSRVNHYIRDGRTLCGRYACFASELAGKCFDGRKDCANCARQAPK